MSWTPARIRSFIISGLRSTASRWPPKYETLKAAFVGKKINAASGREAKHYLCAHCEGEFPSSKVQVDHINPVVDPKVGFTTWDTFIDRLFCTEEGLQVLCSTCHKKKTEQERKERNASKHSS